MICPSKTCRIEIDDDSKFCDHCGSEILICPKCQTPGTGKFCPRDGQRLESLKKKTVLPEDNQAPNQIQNNQAVLGQTQRINLNENGSAGGLKLVHSSGKELEIKNGDILGRREGNHEPFLSGFKYVSGRHALFIFNNKWYIKDLGSTNKTFINGTVIEPEKEFQIKQGDIIKLADQEFTVNEN